MGLIAEAVDSGARVEKACDVVGLDARTLQRWRRGAGEDLRCGPKTSPGNRLTGLERARILRTVNEPSFCDLSPKQIVPRLADQGRYLASESTIYRILRQEGQQRHREPTRARGRVTRPAHKASGPNQLWSWDITFLRSDVAGQFHRLYLIEDVWSRKIVGFSVHAEESDEHATALFLRTCAAMNLDPYGLVFHSDNGSPMKGATLKATLERLGVMQSFSRPHTSDDNPYSESLFRTLKYRPDFPSQPFASIEEASAWVAQFVAWYNQEHLHSGIRFVTPADRHSGRDIAILSAREAVYRRAQARHPERWSRSTRSWERPEVVHLVPERECAA